MIAGPFLAIGIFYLFWTGNYTSAIPWWVPMLSLILLGISFSLIFIPFLSYLVSCLASFPILCTPPPPFFSFQRKWNTFRFTLYCFNENESLALIVLLPLLG